MSDGKESFGQKSERKGEKTAKTVCGDAFHTLVGDLLQGRLIGHFVRT